MTSSVRSASTMLLDWCVSTAETDGDLPGPHLFPGWGGERAGPVPEGARQVRQDQGGQDDGGRREDDELHRAAETGNQVSIGPKQRNR